MVQLLHNADATDEPPVESSEVDLIHRVAREMRLMSSFSALFSHAVAERVGMPNTDIETMDLLNVLGPMTAGQLAQMTGLSTGATTRLIDRLEHAGLVRRRHDAADRRRVFIEPVYENLSEIGALFTPLAAKLGELWSTFSDADLDTVLRFTVQTRAAIAAENARLRGQAADTPG